MLTMINTESDEIAALNMPKAPNELWGLWMPGSDRWVPPLDDEGDESLLTFTSEAAAEKAVDDHKRKYNIECVALRLFSNNMSNTS